ncbi:peptidase S8/S53 domain-containing protein [Zychaea mexicana]|uniref:peptidase S8/S53 domain-containing protein n=1 Tax=Zychaea mexicana TaxID=64656 RepID=UPI0022FEBD41|nr:peptidase S8/S53 domain-containing protein [Zychaea mexicana]KAI9488313.1 peptidase S8/S53 domain-containing protein [Zychaea mexicana]
MTAPNIFDYEFLRGATIQVDRNHDHLHQSIAMTASGFEGVVKVHPVAVLPPPSAFVQGGAPDGEVENAELLLPHSQTQVDRVHSELNYTGKGIVVGIIDTGVDYMHPALGGGFGEGYKVRYGRDLVGDEYDGITNEPQPDDDPMESCTPSNTSGFLGHGTHIAGILAGKLDNFTGVAPDATLAMWRIYSCKDYSSTELAIQGALEAADAGVDIISLSFGKYNPWSESLFSTVIGRIAANGTKVIVASGNDGLNGAFTTMSPAASQDVMSVASFNANHQIARIFRMSGSDSDYAYTPNGFPGENRVIPDGQVVLGSEQLGSGSDACNQSMIPESVRGKIAFVQTGGCDLQYKVGNLSAAGAIGVLSFATVYEWQEPSGPIIQGAAIPVAVLSTQTGLKLGQAIQSSKEITLTFSNEDVAWPLQDVGNMASFFSSIGPTYENNLKPDIGGIGGYLFSTLPRNMGYWGTNSGTSMACPYIAGATALYLEYLGDGASEYSNTDIRERFMNYAYKAPLSPDQDDLNTPLHQGAGLIQLYDAITQTVHVSPSSFSFNDTAHLVKSHTLTIYNDGDDIASFELVNSVSVSVIPYNSSTSEKYVMSSPPQFGTDTARLRFSKKTIKLSPGDSTEVTVSVIPPDTDPDEHIMYGGYVQFKSTIDSQKDITVPYFGIVGDQHRLPIFYEDGPVLMDTNMTTPYTTDDVYIFDLDDVSNTMPVFLAMQRTGTRRLLVIVYDQDENYLGYIQPPGVYDYRTHTTMTNLVTQAVYVWDGTYYEIGQNEPVNLESLSDAVTVNRGSSYRVGIQALKIFGDENNADDWETWTSGLIQVQ